MLLDIQKHPVSGTVRLHLYTFSQRLPIGETDKLTGIAGYKVSYDKRRAVYVNLCKSF